MAISLSPRLSDLRERAKVSSEAIIDSVGESFVDLDTEETAWGQYLKPPDRSQQHGVYGTGMAIELFHEANITDQQILEEILRAQNYLVRAWEADKSKVSDDDEQGITFKHIWFLRGLSDFDFRSIDLVHNFGNRSETAQKYARRLWKKRIEGTGWGNYCYLNGEIIKTDEEANKYATIQSLRVLLRYPAAYEENLVEFSEIMNIVSRGVKADLQKNIKENVGTKKTVASKAALCLLTLLEARTSMSDHATPDWVDERIRQIGYLLNELITDERDFSPGEYEIYLFTVPSKEDDPLKYQNNYIIYVPKVLVSLAFIKMGRLNEYPNYHARNWDFIKDGVSTYARKIGDGQNYQNDSSNSDDNLGYYPSPETDLPAVGDHYWLYRLLTEFGTLEKNDIRTRSWVRGKVSGNVYFGVILFLLIIVPILLASEFLFSGRFQVNLIETILIAVVGVAMTVLVKVLIESLQ